VSDSGRMSARWVVIASRLSRSPAQDWPATNIGQTMAAWGQLAGLLEKTPLVTSLARAGRAIPAPPRAPFRDLAKWVADCRDLA
jgi:hypothetical protein